jgi:hypothetical protein
MRKKKYYIQAYMFVEVKNQEALELEEALDNLEQLQLMHPENIYALNETDEDKVPTGQMATNLS